jgi:predicted phosphoribosyltransferase
MFRDRQDAGSQLGETLAGYAGTEALVLAIPRGGVEIGYEIARSLKLDFSAVVSRKLPFPDNPEAGFGAIAEDGAIWLNPEARYVPRQMQERIIREQKEEIRRRIEVYRGGQPLPPFEGRTVILADDGIAMGSTMRVSVMFCRNRNAGRVIVAVPVIGADQAEEFRALADEFHTLTIPLNFYAVTQVYENWYDMRDDEVLGILARYQKEKQR